MELYLLKSALCIAIFYAFYKGILEGTTMHTFKRFYLMGTLLVSFIIPLVTFTTYVEVSPEIQSGSITTSTLPEYLSNETTTVFLPYLFWGIYALGVLFFTLRFFRNLKKMILKIRMNPKCRNHNIINVLISEDIVPHTFFSYIFFNKRRYENNAIPKEVVLHEMTHAKEKHSFDIIIVELLSIIFWFNPLVYLIRHSVRLNHEFLADRAVLKQGADTIDYQKTILAYSSNASSPQLANSLNYSFIKKRFNVMQTHTSKKGAWIRGLLIIPILVFTTFGFSERQQLEIPPKKTTIVAEIQQDSATREEMKEYDRLAKKYNAMDKEDRIVLKKDLQRLEYIYNKMSAKQKADAEPFPECIPPPPPPPAPAAKIPPPPPTPDTPIVVKGSDKTNIKAPEPPGEPPFETEEPINHIKRMARQNAAFLYEDKGITADEAIRLFKNNSNLNIETTFFEKSNPIVNISKQGYTPK